MTISEIICKIESAQGTNAKLAILREQKDNMLLKKVFAYGLDTFKKFNVVKIPKSNVKCYGWVSDEQQWENFFAVADRCAAREVTGNAAIAAISYVFETTTEQNEIWMRKILQKNFKIGANLSTIEKVFPGIVKTFEVQLAGKWSQKTAAKLPSIILVEPKLDGIRLVSRVESGVCTMKSRAGKTITNFDDTIGKVLSTFPDGVYDGEVLDDDFIALMRQVHRKEANVTQSYLTLFDVVPLAEWDQQKGITKFKDRRKMLEQILTNNDNSFVRLGEQVELRNNQSDVRTYHDQCFARGFEGAMAKDPDSPYCFGRGDAVLKIKDTLESDCPVVGFQEGEGKYVGMLGALLVDFEGVIVDVGTGLKDHVRKEVWDNKDFYLGKIAEIRYQEITEKGSMRFPRFRFWRLDR